LKTSTNIIRGLGAYTLLELLVGVTISSAIFAVILTSGVAIYRSSSATDDYSYQTNEQLRAVDYISRDLRSALSVTIPPGGQTLSVTLPDAYAIYDSKGNPMSAPVDPTIVNAAPVYGNAAQPVVVTYYVHKGSLLRQQIVQSTDQTNQLVIARNVNDLQLSFASLSTAVKFSLTFAPRQHHGVTALRAGTTVAATVATRMLRIK
jgi:type II secretory pathway component PulJ